MKTTLRFLVLLSFAATGAMAAEGFPEDLDAYLGLFAPGHVPTLADFRKVHPNDDDEDLLRQIMVCEKNHWGPAKAGPGDPCARCLARAEKEASRTPSLYLRWLGGILPPVRSLRVVEVKTVRGPDRSGKEQDLYQVILAREGKTEVVFTRRLLEEERRDSGPIEVSAVNGIPLDSLFIGYCGKLEEENQGAKAERTATPKKGRP